MPLTNLINKGHKNLVEITSVNQIPKSGSFLLTVGAPWCGHCQQEFKEVINPLCTTLKKTKCLALDGSSEDGQKFLQTVGLPVRGFPTSLACKVGADQKVSCVDPIEGAYPMETFKQVINVAKLEA